MMEQGWDPGPLLASNLNTLSPDLCPFSGLLLITCIPTQSKVLGDGATTDVWAFCFVKFTSIILTCKFLG